MAREVDRSLIADFVLPLVPIAAAYLIAHYFTLFLIQGQFIVTLISDPFGRGWDLFGTADFAPNLAIVSPETTWYVQVAALVVGMSQASRLRTTGPWRSSRGAAGARSAAPDARADGPLHAGRNVAAYAWLAHGGIPGAIIEASVAIAVVGVLVWAWHRERRRGHEPGVEENGGEGDSRS